MNERIVFMGTTNFSGYILEKLLENNYNVVAVVSQPDRKTGRKQEIKPTITKEIALNNNIDVYSRNVYGYRSCNSNSWTDSCTGCKNIGNKSYSPWSCYGL